MTTVRPHGKKQFQQFVTVPPQKIKKELFFWETKFSFLYETNRVLLNLYSFFLTGRSLGLRAEEEKKIKKWLEGEGRKGKKRHGSV